MDSNSGGVKFGFSNSYVFGSCFLLLQLLFLDLGSGQIVNISLLQVAQSVGIYLGIPFVAGVTTRFVFLRIKGREWYEHNLMHKLGHTSLIALLFTIVVKCFHSKGNTL